MKDKATKRREAEERQARYNKLSLREKIERAALRVGVPLGWDIEGHVVRGMCGRELSKLHAQELPKPRNQKK